MKNQITILLLLVAAIVSAQSPRVFTAKCNVAQSGSGSGYWQVAVTSLNDPGGLDATEIQTSDKLLFNDGGIQYTLNITTVISAVGASATIRVSNVGVTGISSVPTTAAVISRATENYSFVPLPANISANDAQLLQEKTMYDIDSLLQLKDPSSTNELTAYTAAGAPPVSPKQGDRWAGYTGDSIFIYNSGSWVFDAVRTSTGTLSILSIDSISRCYPYQALSEKLAYDSIANVVLLGDSRTQAYYTPDALMKLFWRFGNAGYGAVSIAGTAEGGYWTKTSSGLTANDNSGTALYDVNGWSADIAAAGYVQYVPKTINRDQNHYTSVDIWFLGDGGSTTFELFIDAVSQGTFTTSGSTVQKATFSGFSDAYHTLKITNIGAATGTLFEVNFKRDNVKGVRFHRLGNGGFTIAQQKALRDNTYFWEDVKPELVYIRLGVNGGGGDPTTQSLNMDSIIIGIKSVGGLDSLTRFVIVGETDNNEAGALKTNMPILNTLYRTQAATHNYGYVDLFGAVPSWDDFVSLGYSAWGNTVHENAKGGIYLANQIFQTAFNSTCSTNSASTYAPSGTANRMTYFPTSSSIGSASSWQTDGDVLGYGYTPTAAKFGVNRLNNTVASFGYISGSSTWFSINDVGGLESLNWNSRYNGTNWVGSNSGLKSAMLRATGTYALDVQTSTTARGQDSVITWTPIFQLGHNGSLLFSKYGTPSTFTGTTSSYAAFNSSGALIQKTVAEMKSELSIITSPVATGTSGRLGYYSSTTGISSANSWYSDGTKLGYGELPTNPAFSIKQSNGTIAGFGTSSSSRYWHTFNDQGGYFFQNWFSYYNGTNWLASGGGISRRWGANASYAMLISSTPGAGVPAKDSVITSTMVDYMRIDNTGRHSWPQYTSATSFTGTTDHFVTQTSGGVNITKTAAEMRTDLELSSNYLPLTGGTLTGHLLFTDNTYDIGASGATRPRTGYFGTSVVAPTIVPTNITGTTTNNDASAGSVGEYTSSVIAIGSSVPLTTATAANVTSISLTAGDWDVEGWVNYDYGTATVTQSGAGINTTSATIPTDGSEAYSATQLTLTSSLGTISLTRKRISIASTTTVYLVGQATFSAGTTSAFGGITARRVR